MPDKYVPDKFSTRMNLSENNLVHCDGIDLDRFTGQIFIFKPEVLEMKVAREDGQRGRREEGSEGPGLGNCCLQSQGSKFGFGAGVS